ncbi:MAG: hypothetical protein WCX31_13915 [Salinivirgaceae bacterium]
MSKVPENKIVNEILNGNDKVLTAVYKNVYKTMERYGNNLMSTEADIKEAVQDAFESFYRQILSGNLILTCSVHTYIVSMAKKNLLLNERHLSMQLRTELFEAESIIDENDNSDEKDDFEKIILEKRREIFRTIYKTLSIECQQIIALTLKGYKTSEIAETMSLISEFYVRTKRMKCKQYLVEKIKENPDYEKLRNANPEDYEVPLRRNEP